MLKKIITLSILFIAVFSYSQEEFDSRLLERYSAQELTEMQKNNPEEFKILNRALDVGISIGTIHEGKENGIVFNGEIEGDPNKEQTFISLGIYLKNEYQYFRFKGTDQFVIVRPKDQILLIPESKTK